jgi:large subunit ribosomal protein L18
MGVLEKRENKLKRIARVRAKIAGMAKVPRISVSRSNKHIFAQIIDSSTGAVIASADDLRRDKRMGENKSGVEGDKTKKAALVGEVLAARALKAGISRVVFDRGGYKYHGRIKALAEGLRKGGLKF